jgi:hypothetical protein
MPVQFVNPVPHMEAGSILCFDFPCGDPQRPDISIEQPSFRVGSDTYVAYSDPADHRVWGNVNLRSPATEALYGKLGRPAREQGHPFLKEFDLAEQEDPASEVFHDQIVDIDRGIQINHTGRLSGDFATFFASKPFFSTILVSAVAVAPVQPATASIQLENFINWLTPMGEAPNVWYWRMGIRDRELMFTADVRLAPGQVIFEPEAVYKLVFRWKFWKYTGADPAPDTPPDPAGGGTDFARLGISGFDEAIAFEVSSPTHEL